MAGGSGGRAASKDEGSGTALRTPLTPATFDLPSQHSEPGAKGLFNAEVFTRRTSGTLCLYPQCSGCEHLKCKSTVIADARQRAPHLSSNLCSDQTPPTTTALRLSKIDVVWVSLRMDSSCRAHSMRGYAIAFNEASSSQYVSFRPRMWNSSSGFSFVSSHSPFDTWLASL